MITNDQIDLDELEKSCCYLKEFFVQKALTDRKSVEIFNALLEQTINYIHEGVDSTLMIFDAQEICTESCNPKEDYNSAKDFISRHRKNFDTLISTHLDEIAHHFELNNIRYLPEIKNTESKGVHRTMFYIGLSPLSERINHKVSLVTNKKSNVIAIEYTIPQLPKPPIWAKSIMSIKIQGWKLYSYIALPIVALALGYFLMVWNIYGISTASIYSAIGFITIISVLYLTVQPFYEAMDKRIAIAPDWLLNLSAFNVLIRATKSDVKRPNGKAYRTLQFVKFQATCPICDGEIDIEKGKYLFKGRLIGLCKESPREHVFSFDHVTKKGLLLL